MADASEIDAHQRGAATRPGRFPDSIESRASWAAALLAICILSISYGAPLIVVVGLKPIAIALGSDRSVVALAAALVWIGTGSGGMLMGWVADRIGMRRMVIFGAVMTALGLAVSATGKRLGALSRAWRADRLSRRRRALPADADLCQPLVRPPPRHRAGADLVRAIRRRHDLAIDISSARDLGRLAGDDAGFWPRPSRRSCRLAAVAAPGAAAGAARSAPRAFLVRGTHALGLRPNTVQALICCAAGFLCCVPMAMPSAISSPFAAISAFRRRRARRCCRYCSAAPLPAGSSGAGLPTGSAGCARYWSARPVRRWRSPRSR